jgi:hypothetical protein
MRKFNAGEWRFDSNYFSAVQKILKRLEIAGLHPITLKKQKRCHRLMRGTALVRISENAKPDSVRPE